MHAAMQRKLLICKIYLYQTRAVLCEGSAKMGAHEEGDDMGDVIPFPPTKATLYDREAIEVLNELPPPRTDRLTYLGSSVLSEKEVAVLARILQKHRDLRAIRVLGAVGDDLVMFRGELPSFRSL